jgi:ABC-type Fe3+-hydroxamate transport system substrate-binding protein
MMIRLKQLRGILSMLLVLTFAIASHSASAQDVVHAVSGVVKSIDKGTKTVVVKAADGTEHTIKYTDKTVVKGAKDTGKGVEKGSVDAYMGAKVGTEVTVKYTEKGAEKTAVGVKEGSEATAKAVSK